MPGIASDAERASAPGGTFVDGPGPTTPAASRFRRRPAAPAAALLAVLLAAAQALAGVTVTESVGTVQVRERANWVNIAHGRILAQGEEIRTGRASRCVLVFDDGSKVEIGPNASFVLQEDAKDTSSMSFNIGRLRAWVTKTVSRRFQVRTPTAVASVRGTEFEVAVQENGASSIACFQGLMAVADQQGNEVLVNEGQQVDVTQAGLGQVGTIESKEAAEERSRSALKREVGLDMSKEEVQAAAALEMRSAIYKEGKAVVDVNGNRVRLEDYIIRSKPNEFKLVVLNERVDRFDYFFFRGVFNNNLPDDISIALSQIGGQAFTRPAFHLTEYEKGWSNTTDKVQETASGGHLVDVNNNNDNAAQADTNGDGAFSARDTDDVTTVLDPASDELVDLSVPNLGKNNNDPFWTTLFNESSIKYNTIEHFGWSSALPGGGDIQKDADRTLRATVSLVTANCEDIDHCSFSESTKLFDRFYEQDATGTTWDRYDNFIISDEGKIGDRADFSGLTKGADFKRVLLQWNYEQVITASEFNGRKIDIVFEPKVLINSGLIK